MTTINVYSQEDVTRAQDVQAWRRLLKRWRDRATPHFEEAAHLLEDEIAAEVRKFGKVEGLR